MQELAIPSSATDDATKLYRIPPPLLLKKTILLALPFLLIVTGTIVTYYSAQVVNVENHARRLNTFAVQDIYLSLQQLLRNIKGDARLLANHPLLPTVLDNPESSAARQLAEQWLAFAAQKRIYDQLRLLDQRGQELLRINLTPEGATVVPKKQLQNKADRYYVREATTLASGEIYLSPLDLNVENGQIEQPLKPMLRIGIPITDRKGNKAGLLILNYLAANILANIKAHSIMADSQTLFINQQGYYLRGFNKAQEWAFMYPDTDQARGQFATDYRTVWQQLQQTRQGQLMNEKGLFDYQWLGTDDVDGTTTPYNRHFVLLSIISAQHMAALKAPYRNAAWAALLLAVPIILVIAALAARFRLQELNAFERLREIEAHQRLILETVGEGIFGLDARGNLTFANPRAIELTGFLPNEMMGHKVHNLLHMYRDNHGDHSPEACPLHDSLHAGQSHRENDDTFWRKNGDTFPVEYISNPIIRDGQLQGGVISFFDITDRKKAEQHIEYLVLNDALTDLPNKKLLLDRLTQQLAAARHTDQLATLLYIDIDLFKQINDALGHDRGDDILIEVANRLKSITQEGDTVARIGSDEFVLLRANEPVTIEQIAHSAQLTADEIMLILDQPFRFDGDSTRLTVSIGITIFPSADEDAATILSQADTAATNAKEAGRNTTRFFKTAMERNTREWLMIHNRMLEALANDTFTLVYQPKVGPKGQLVGLEALLRWHDAELGVVSPAQFVPIAEQSGLIMPLSEFVLASACRQIRAWYDAGLGNTIGHVAVNISPAHFSDKNFVSYVLQHIEQSGIPAHALELEITERTLVDDIADTREKVLALREQGVRFSIDDFGTGYSSLAYLQQLPLDRLKIDRTFVTDVHAHPDRQTIVEAIILLARGLSIEVIAEGVENESELNYLLNAGCREFQGYYFFRPMPVDELTGLLRQQADISTQEHLQQ